MRLTIVTVVKNDSAGVNCTLASIALQDSAVRVLVIDGGSTDGSLDTIHDWRTSLLLDVTSELDAGPYDAMNKALARLNDDDLVWFVNAGDALHGKRAVSQAMQLTRQPNFAWGFGPHRVVEDDGKLRRIVRGSPYSLANHAYGRTPICHQAVVARVACLNQVGRFDTRYPIAADFRALLMLGERWRPEQWEAALINYRAGGISDRNLSTTIKEQGRIRREILKPRGSSLVLDHLHDSKRLARNNVRNLAIQIGIDPARLNPPPSRNPEQRVGDS